MSRLLVLQMGILVDKICSCVVFYLHFFRF